MTPTNKTQKPKPAPKPNTQKYPVNKRPDQKKWESEIRTSKDRQEYRDWYGKNPS